MTLGELTESAPGDASANVGTVRTTANAFVIIVIVWLISKVTSQTVDPSDPLVLIGAPAVIGFGYRLSRFIAAKWPSVAWLLFGIGTPPNYVSTEVIEAPEFP